MHRGGLDLHVQLAPADDDRHHRGHPPSSCRSAGLGPSPSQGIDEEHEVGDSDR